MKYDNNDKDSTPGRLGTPRHDFDGNEITPPTREEMIRAAFEKYHASLGVAETYDDQLAEDAFTSGFESGARLGFTEGHRAGGRITHEQLHAPISAAPLLAGNQLVRPNTKMESIREDQLTAEFCELLARYAILPSEVRMRALIEAARSMGYEVKL